MTDDTKNDDRYTVPALARGLQLLMQFNREERQLSGAELSRRLDLPRASVFRMLYTLEQGGFVEKADDGVSYKLGLAVLRLRPLGLQAFYRHKRSRQIRQIPIMQMLIIVLFSCVSSFVSK